MEDVTTETVEAVVETPVAEPVVVAQPKPKTKTRGKAKAKKKAKVAPKAKVVEAVAEEANVPEEDFIPETTEDIINSFTNAPVGPSAEVEKLRTTPRRERLLRLNKEHPENVHITIKGDSNEDECAGKQQYFLRENTYNKNSKTSNVLKIGRDIIACIPKNVDAKIHFEVEKESYREVNDSLTKSFDDTGDGGVPVGVLKAKIGISGPTGDKQIAGLSIPHSKRKKKT